MIAPKKESLSGFMDALNTETFTVENQTEDDVKTVSICTQALDDGTMRVAAQNIQLFALDQQSEVVFIIDPTVQNQYPSTIQHPSNTLTPTTIIWRNITRLFMKRSITEFLPMRRKLKLPKPKPMKPRLNFLE